MGSTSVPIDELDEQAPAQASSVPIDDLDVSPPAQQLTPNASYDPLASSTRTSSDPITRAAQGRPRLGAAFSDVVGTPYTQPDAQTQAAVARINSPQAAASKAAGMPLADVSGRPHDPQLDVPMEYNPKTGMPFQPSLVPEADAPGFIPGAAVPRLVERTASGLGDLGEAFTPQFNPASGKYERTPAGDEAKKRQMYGGASDVVSGVGGIGMQVAPIAVMNKPVATAASFALGYGASEASGAVAHKMGASSEAEELTRNLAFFLPSIAGTLSGLKTGSVETPEGKFSAASVLGGKARAGVASTPDTYSGRVKVGDTQFEVNIPRSRPAPPPEPSEAAKALASFEQASGNPDFQPPPPPPVDKGPQHLTPDIVQGVSDTIMQAPAEKRPDLMVEAHANMAKWMMGRGTFTGPDHKIYTVDSDAQAKRLASKFINDEVDRKDAEQEQAAKTATAAESSTTGKQPQSVKQEPTIEAPVSGKPPAQSGMTTETAAVENVSQKAQLHPEQKPAVMVKEEPPKQAAALAKPPAQVHPQDVAPIGTKDKESDRTILQPSTDVMQNERLASQAAPELATKLSHIAAGVDGATFDRLRPQKELQRVDEKVDDAGKPPETVPDYLAAQIAADSPQAKDSLIQELQKNFKVVSVEDSFLEGRPKLAGYPSANVQVMMGNGLTAEVQIVPREIQESANESHKFYTAGREAELRGDHAEKDKQFAEATKLHDAAMDKFRARNGIEKSKPSPEEYIWAKLKEKDIPIHTAFTGEGLKAHFDLPPDISLRDMESYGLIVKNDEGLWEFAPHITGEADRTVLPRRTAGPAKEIAVPQHEFASTQINVDPQSELGQAHAQAVAKIPQEHVGKEGIEKTPHVTIRYGLKDDSPTAIEKIKQAAAQIQPFDVPVGKTSLFPPSEYSSGDYVAKADLEATPELKALRDAIEQAGDFRPDTFKSYEPHITLAYVKPAHAEQYKGGSQLEGHSVPVKEIVVSKRDGSQEVIPLGGQAGHSVPIDELEAPSQTKGDGVGMPRKLQHDISLASEEKQWERAVKTPGALVTITRDSLGLGREGRDGVVIEGAKKPHSLDDSTDQVLVEHEGLQGKPVQTWFSATDLSPSEKDSVNAAPASPLEAAGHSVPLDELDKIERRTNPVERKRVSDMSPAEKDKELLTSEKTGLPNYRAFQEDEGLYPHVGYADVDDFKPFNTTLGKVAVDTKVLPRIGEAFQRAAAKEPGGSIKVYHRSGDEFLFRTKDKEAVTRIVDRVNQELKTAKFTAESPDGQIHEKIGAGLSHGTGKSESAAEHDAEHGPHAGSKPSRKATGLRSGSRDLPERVGEESAQRKQASEVRDSKELKPATPDVRKSALHQLKEKNTAKREATAGELRQAHADWAGGRAYLQNGSYWLHGEIQGFDGKRRIAPWNKLAKQTYADNEALHSAAKADFPTREAAQEFIYPREQKTPEPEAPSIAQFDEAVKHTGAEVKEGKPSEEFTEKIKEATHLEPANDAELKKELTGATYQREYLKSALQQAKDAYMASMNAKGNGGEAWDSFASKKLKTYSADAAPDGFKTQQLYIKVPDDGHFLVNNTPFAIEKALKGAREGFTPPKQQEPRLSAPRSPKEFDNEKYIVQQEKELADLKDKRKGELGNTERANYLDEQIKAANQNLTEAKKLSGAPIKGKPGERGFARMDVPGVVLSAPFKQAAEFYKQDVSPTLKGVTGGLKEVVTQGLRLVAPRMNVPSHLLDTIMRMKGEREEEMFRFQRTTAGIKKMFDKLPESARISFIDNMMHGRRQPSIELEDVAEAIRQIQNRFRDQEKVFKADLTDKENYFHLKWKKLPQGVDEEGNLVEGTGGDKPLTGQGNRPLQGGRSFMKRKTLPDASTGIKRGGELLTTNPIGLLEHRVMESLKFTTARNMWEELKSTPYTVSDKGRLMHMVQFFREGQEQQAKELGYEKLNDRISKVLFPAGSGEGMLHPGEYWVEDNTARLLNNFLSRDLIRETAVGRGIVGLKNATTAWRLAFSPFHALTESIITTGSEIGRGIEHSFNQGVRGASPTEIARGIATAAKAPVAPFSAAREGGSAIRYVTSPQAFLKTTRGQSFIKQYPQAAELISDLFTGGAKLAMHEDYRMHMAESIRRAIADNNYIGALLRSPGAVSQAIQYPLFEVYIPRLKLGMFLREYSEALQDKAEELDAGKLTRAKLARQTWDNIDYRFGEVNWDNFFFNRTFKTSLQLAFRAFAWRFGNFAFAGSAATGQTRQVWESLKFLKDAATDGESARPGTNAIPKLDPRMAKLIGLAIFGVIAHGLLQYAFTHEKPKDVKDLVAFRDGTMDAHGHPNRWTLPIVPFRDLESMRANPGAYLRGGIADIWTAIPETINNRDFRNQLISHPSDPYWEQMYDKAAHVVGMPIGVDRYKQEKKRGEGTSTALLGEAGLSRATNYELSPAEKKMREIQIAHYGPQTDEDLELKEKKDERIQAGHLTADERRRKIMDGMKNEFQKGMRSFTYEQARQVYDLASPDEKAIMGILMLEKRFNSLRRSVGQPQ